MQSLVEELEMVTDARESIECAKTNNAACLPEMIGGDLARDVLGRAKIGVCSR